MQENYTLEVDGSIKTPPYPAFKIPGYPLGTDRFGRDLLSRILWGLRPTMLMVTAVAAFRLGEALARERAQQGGQAAPLVLEVEQGDAVEPEAQGRHRSHRVGAASASGDADVHRARGEIHLRAGGQSSRHGDAFA